MVDSTQKKTIIEQYLDSGKTILVVNGTVDGVMLPSYLLFSDHVKLSLTRAVEQKVRVTAKKVTANLNFDGEPFSVTIPMEAIYGVYTSVDDMCSFDDCLPESTEKTLQTLEKAFKTMERQGVENPREGFYSLLEDVMDNLRRAERRGRGRGR